MYEVKSNRRYHWKLDLGCLPGVTEDPHALIEVQGTVYAFWGDQYQDDKIKNDGKMFYSTFDNVSRTWATPKTVGRDEDKEYTRTWETPSVTFLNGKLTICWHRMYKWEMYTATLEAGAWSKAVQLIGHAAYYTSPAIISTPTGDLVTFVGRNSQVWYSYLRKSSNIIGPINEAVKDTYTTKNPALLPLREDRSLIALYWTDKDSGDIRCRLWDNEKGWDKNHTVIHKGVADTGPSVYWVNDTTFIVWSKKNRIYYSFTTNGVNWSLPERVMFYEDLFFSKSQNIDRGVTVGFLNNEPWLAFGRDKRTLTARYREAESLTFVVLTDVHVTSACADPTNWQTNLFLVDAIKKHLPTMVQEGTNEPFGEVDFALVTGDLTYSEGLSPLQHQVDNFFQMFSRLGIPVHPIAGNHDTTQSYSPPISTDLFDRIKKVHGGYPYTFDCKGVRFAALRGDEHLPIGIDFGNEETNNRFLDEELQINEHTPLVVMCHYGFDHDMTIPKIWTRETARKAQIDRLRNRKFLAYFSGHSHISRACEIPVLGPNRNLVGGTSMPYENQHQFWAVRIVGRTMYASLISWSGKVGTIWTETIELQDQNGKPAGTSSLLTWTF